MLAQQADGFAHLAGLFMPATLICMQNKQENNTTGHQALNRAEQYEELLAIYSDLRLFLFALQRAPEADPADKLSVPDIPYTGIRIADRLGVIVETFA